LNNGFISDSTLRKEFTLLKKQPSFQWLNDVSNDVAKQAIKDACEAYKKYFKKKAKLPKFKRRNKSKPSFYEDAYKIQFTETHVKLTGFSSSKKRNKQKLNWIRLAEKNRVPIGVTYKNPRVTFDGLNWWLSIGFEVEENVLANTFSNGIGIDLGIKDLATCSDGVVYKNINKSETVRKIKKRHKRLQRRISRKYNMNKEGKNYCKTNNIARSEKQLLKLTQRLNGIRKNYLHQTTTEIIRRKPSFIVLEDLNVKGMMKNKHLANAVAEQCFYMFRTFIEYKSCYDGIKIIIAGRFYPSSKLCSDCGNKKEKLKLSERTYVCHCCGNVKDRDFNASLNLEHYGLSVI
jgi:putative transposase